MIQRRTNVLKPVFADAALSWNRILFILTCVWVQRDISACHLIKLWISAVGSWLSLEEFKMTIVKIGTSVGTMNAVVFIRNGKGVIDACLSCQSDSTVDALLCPPDDARASHLSAPLQRVWPFLYFLNRPQYLYAKLEHLAPYSMSLVSEKDKIRIKRSC